ncbi:nephrosis 1, congenital, Finnish type (nephrin) [Cichlidogyrus casuarinus]|uniref:Nephrosis 1, congenital, Finnish type (Nephrin) n=1 Tax=Cichlidogyrus casuarinus TaxID=1844966 RepID=A0ABD2PTI1_9PLAT
MKKNEKAGGELGENIKLEVYVYTEPTPGLAWAKLDEPNKGNVIQIEPEQHMDLFKTIERKRSDKYVATLQHIEPGLYVARLDIHRLERNDFGTYQIHVSNPKGMARQSIPIIGTSKPDVPTKLQLIYTTERSAKIAWTQGFDGGYKQTFQVRWKSEGGTAKYEDVSSSDESGEIIYEIHSRLTAETQKWVIYLHFCGKGQRPCFILFLSSPFNSLLAKVMNADSSLATNCTKFIPSPIKSLQGLTIH